jgi:hypothetical protein
MAILINAWASQLCCKNAQILNRKLLNNRGFALNGS